MVEAERGVEGMIVDEDAEQGKNVEHVELEIGSVMLRGFIGVADSLEQ